MEIRRERTAINYRYELNDMNSWTCEVLTWGFVGIISVAGFVIYLRSCSKEVNGAGISFIRLPILFIILLLSINLVFLSLAQMGVLDYLNTYLDHFFCGIKNGIFKKISTDINNNIPTYLMGFFTVGLVVLTLASSRQNSNINPYSLSVYFPVLGYLSLIVNVLVVIIYLKGTGLYSLMFVCMILYIPLCLAVPAYLYIFHTSAQIGKQMAKILKKKIKQESNEYDFSKRDKRLYISVINDIVKWHHVLILDSNGDDLFLHAEHHAMAFHKLFSCYSLRKLFLKENGWLPFLMGYATIYPGSSIGAMKRRRYFRYILSTYHKLIPKNKKIQLIESYFWEGILCSQVQQCFFPANGSSKDTYLKVGDGVESFINDCRNAMGKDWYKTLKINEAQWFAASLFIYLNVIEDTKYHYKVLKNLLFDIYLPNISTQEEFEKWSKPRIGPLLSLVKFERLQSVRMLDFKHEISRQGIEAIVKKLSNGNESGGVNYALSKQNNNNE